LIDFDVQQDLKINYIPIYRTDKGIALAKGKKANRIINGFYERSSKIMEEGFIEREYQKFANKNIKKYIQRFARFGKWKSRFDNRLFKGALSEKAYSKRELLAIRNYIECEAHRELLLKSLKNR